VAANGANGTGASGPLTASSRDAAAGPAGAVRPAGAGVILRSAGKTFRRRGRRTVALAGVDLDIRAGEFVCLCDRLAEAQPVGASGA
jgi:hypothetical protein